MPSSFKLAVIVFLLCGLTAGAACAEDRLFRFPDIHNDLVVFSHAGDLWTVSATGGQARRVTTHEGLELFGRFSPDGKQIAFSGEYDGDMNVYVMPTTGGTPKQLSYHPGYQRGAERMGPENQVLGWTPDGSNILFRSRKFTHEIFIGHLYLIGPEGGYPTQLPVPEGSFTKFSPDGKKIVYTPIGRDFRQWKRYKGGMAQDVWIFDLETYDAEKITDWVGSDNVPLWIGDKIYFNSDRTGTLNLYVYDPVTKQTSPVTNYTEYDVRWPESGPGGKIIFENGGYLHVLDVNTGQTRKVEVTLGDDRTWMRPEYVKVAESISDYNLSPDGKRALFGARGEIFTVPAKHGNTRNLTNTAGVNEKYSTWSPDGKWIAYMSDKTGEDELYIIPADGTGEEIRLTFNGHCYRYHMLWSPDSKKLAWSDKNTELYWLDIDRKEPILIDDNPKGELRDFGWSPDAKWIVYSKPGANDFDRVYLYSLADKTSRPITTGMTDDHGATFDPEGKYIYFVSKRNYNAMLGNEDFVFVNRNMQEIVAVPLSAAAPSPFAPRSDEVEINGGEDNDDAKDDDGEDKNKKKDRQDKDITIDFAGIEDRQVTLPIDAGSYGGLRPVNGRLFYFSFGFGGLSGRLGEQRTDLHVFDLEEREDHVFLKGITGYDISADGKKLIYRKGTTYGIIDASGKAGSLEGGLNLDGMEMYLDREAEYRQMFNEAWRLQRDFFYDSNMHGLDWPAIYDRYAPLVAHAAHRFDLTYIIAEMIGELACSHTYTGGGDRIVPEASGIGLLGVDWAIDSTSGRYRIGHILLGQNWVNDRRSPLTEPGIEVAEGDYVLKINGHNVVAADNPYRLLVKQAGKTVTLTVNDKPSLDGAREVTVKTISSEVGLRYYNWVENNRRYVDSVTNGRIGYIHIPDMGGNGLNEFVRLFYPQLDKEALIIDERGNGGGFVSQLILERLRRELVGMRAPRNWEVNTVPGRVFTGPMVCLANQYSCSDGDNFPYYFKKYGLGPVIGKRTWGGVVGIRGHRQSTDGGYVRTPEFSTYNLEREWVMENVGVEPDIEVENLPKRVIAGFDDQLIKAIEVLNEKLAEQKIELPERPDTPKER